MAQNAISGPLEIAQSLLSGSKSHIWAFGDRADIARWLRMPFLAFWRLHGHCAVIARCLRISVPGNLRVEVRPKHELEPEPELLVLVQT